MSARPFVDMAHCEPPRHAHPVVDKVNRLELALFPIGVLVIIFAVALLGPAK